MEGVAKLVDLRVIRAVDSAAGVLDPTVQVNPLCNWLFTAASSVVIVGLGWFLTERIVEPRLASVPVDGDPADMPRMEAITPAEERGLRWGLSSFVVACGVLAFVALPSDSALRSAQREKLLLADGTSYDSQVELRTGEIGLDLAHFLEQSEQTPSAAMVGVLEGPEGVRAAGGMIVELMPDADAGTVERLESNLETLDGVSRWLEAGGTEALVGAVLAGLDREVVETAEVRFRCRCNRQSLLDRLLALSAEDRAEVADEDGKVPSQRQSSGASEKADRNALAELRPLPSLAQVAWVVLRVPDDVPVRRVQPDELERTWEGVALQVETRPEVGAEELERPVVSNVYALARRGRSVS